MTQKILTANHIIVNISAIAVLSTLIINFIKAENLFSKLLVISLVSTLFSFDVPDILTGRAAILAVITGTSALVLYKKPAKSLRYLISMFFIFIYFLARQIFIFLISIFLINSDVSQYISLSSDFFSLIVICIVSGICLFRRKNHNAYICMLLLFILIIFNISNFLVLYEITFNFYLVLFNSITFAALLFLLLLDIEILRDTKLRNDDYEKLQTSSIKMRSYIHDQRNQMHAMAGYIQMKDLEGLRKYFTNIKYDLNSIHNIQVINEYVKKDPGLFGIICAKQSQSERYGLDFRVNISCKLFSKKLSSEILHKITGILLDNAFEAASESSMKYVELNLTKMHDDRLILEICNSVMPGHTVLKENIFSYGFTTKNDHMGIGLWELKKILDSSGLDIMSNQTGELFVQRIVFK